MLSLMFTAGIAGAEIKSGAVTFTPTIGQYVFEGHQGIEDEVTYGAGLGYNLDEHWAAEVVFNYIDTEFDSSMNMNGRDADVYVYHADLLYHFMPAKNSSLTWRQEWGVLPLTLSWEARIGVLLSITAAV